MPVPTSERHDRRQQTVMVYGQNIKLPYLLNEDEEFNRATEFLNQEPMWFGHFSRKKIDRKCSAISLERNIGFDFHPINWQSDRVESIGTYSPPKKIGGLLISSQFDDLGRVDDLLSNFVDILPPKSPVVVVEDKGDNYRQGLESREKILENRGLVKRKILIQAPTDFGPVKEKMIWRSRTAAEYKGKAVNLIDEGPKWRKPWVSEKIQQAADDYRQLGFLPLNAHEAGGRLRESKNPPWDLGGAELGFGFELLGPCGGCKWRVTLSGDWIRVLDCGDSDCTGSY